MFCKSRAPISFGSFIGHLTLCTSKDYVGLCMAKIPFATFCFLWGIINKGINYSAAVTALCSPLLFVLCHSFYCFPILPLVEYLFHKRCLHWETNSSVHFYVKELVFYYCRNHALVSYVCVFCSFYNMNRKYALAVNGQTIKMIERTEWLQNN